MPEGDALGPVGGYVALVVVAGVKQKAGAALDTDMADTEEGRPGGLAMSRDAEQLSGPVGLIDHRLESGYPSTHAIALRGSGQRRWLKSSPKQDWQV
jgi:hypothetical protein